MSYKRFRIAFSFAGEKRDYVSKVADILARRFGEEAILYDKYHEAEFSRPDLAFYLPDLYHHHSDLVVAVICPDYEGKEWCGLEWNAIFGLIKERKVGEVMLARFDCVEGKGLHGLAGYTDLDHKSPEQVATLILERLALNEDKPKGHYTALSRQPSESPSRENPPCQAPGGAMAVNDVHYIERVADQNAKADAKRRCETIVVKGPRQFGKSSLLARYLALCRANGKAVAWIDFALFEDSITSDYSRFLTRLAWEIARCFLLAPPAGGLETQQEFNAFIESTLLPALKDPVVFAFDLTERMMRQNYTQDFFSMVRMWHDKRADSACELRKLGLALTTSSEPKLFIKDPLRSPFNVVDPLRLKAFAAEEVATLNARYGAPLSDADCTELYRLLGGHPFLTQQAYYKLFGPESISFTQLCNEATQEDGPFGEHLRAMLSNLNSAEGLLAAVMQVIAKGTVPRLEDFYRLQGAGLVRRENRQIVPTNQIYAEFFRGA